jgi:arsenate reductase
MEKQTVLFICSYNSVRSQMAEGLLRARCGDRFEVFSAGLATAGINPYALQVMKEIGIDISHQPSRSLNSFSGKNFDYVITLCDRVPLATSQVIPSGERVYHRGFSSPSETRKDKDAVIEEFRTLRDDIGAWLGEVFPGYLSNGPEKPGQSPEGQGPRKT